MEAITGNATTVQLTEQPDPTQLLTCYNIPYGVYGFVANLFTFLSLVVALTKKDPRPVGSTISGIVSWVLQIIAVVGAFRECGGAYHMLAVWRLAAFIPVPLAQSMLRISGQKVFMDPARAIIPVLLLIPGLVPGIIALHYLVEQNWHLSGVRTVTWVFSGFAILIVVIFLLSSIYLLVEDDPGERETIFCYMPAVLLSLVYCMMVGYADWVIAITVHNIGGFPFKTVPGILHFVGSIVDAVFGFYIACKASQPPQADTLASLRYYR